MSTENTRTEIEQAYHLVFDGDLRDMICATEPLIKFADKIFTEQQYGLVIHVDSYQYANIWDGVPVFEDIVHMASLDTLAEKAGFNFLDINAAHAKAKQYDMPLAEGFMSVLGLDKEKFIDAKPNFYRPPDGEGVYLEQLVHDKAHDLRNRGVYVLLNLEGAGSATSDAFRENLFPILATDLIRDAQTPIVIIAGFEQASSDLRALYLHLADYCKIVRPTSIWEVCDLLLHARCLLTVESGTAHLAAMLDIPSLVLCPTSFQSAVYSYALPCMEYHRADFRSLTPATLKVELDNVLNMYDYRR